MRTKTDTDGHIVGLARRLEQHRRAIDDVIAEVRSSGHPNAEALEEQCWFPAWPEHVVRHHLRYPDDWEADDAGIRRRRKRGRQG
jgi:cysteine synthase